MKKFLITCVLIGIALLTVSCKTTTNQTTESAVDETSAQSMSPDIRDYVCVINSSYHPNIDKFLSDIIRSAMDDPDLDGYAMILENIRRGGFGSGFVYVDAKGDNYIITNHHVIEGAERFSVTFENDNGEQVRYLNLNVINADAKADLAILAFPNGQRPFTSGLTFSGISPHSSLEVWAAGYPGLGNNPVWGFTRGNISNARIQLSGYGGWYIQHDGSVNPGNSGGPLLIVDENTPLGYSVLGINTLSISEERRSFSIPVEMVFSFLEESFREVDEVALLESRIKDFIALINKSQNGKSQNGMVYEELTPFLSGTMIASQPLLEFNTLPDSMDDMKAEILLDPINKIGWAVAYNQIENYVYSKDKDNFRAELGTVEANNFGGYTVKLLIGGYPYRTEWTKNHRIWYIDSFTEDDGEYNDTGDLATPHPLSKKVKYTFASTKDHDWYILDIPRAGKLTVYTEGQSDPEIELRYDPEDDDYIALNDDDPEAGGLNAKVSVDVKAGPLYVWVVYRGTREPSGTIAEYTLIAQLEE
ncbi:MAG: S1C family serine protease [Treponema sp.]|nr:S1C family serine protease [Treponema sp.]